MALDLRLDTKLSQSLVMTPRLQQAIKLLQYNHQEMVDHIQEAMLENPTLETVPETEDAPEGDAVLQAGGEKVASDEAEQRNGNTESDAVDWERIIEQMGDRKPSASTGGTVHDELPPIETNLTYGESLAEHLMWQIQMLRCLDEERAAMEAIVQNLDDRGYFVTTVEELATQLELDPADVEFARQTVAGLDPAGCAAKDLPECLIFQAILHFPDDENFPKILATHLHNLEKRNYVAISRDLGIDVEDVVEYHRMIQELEPHPGRGFTAEEPRYITPDLYVVKMGGEWQIQLNEEGVPDLRISRYYQQILRGASKSDKEYLLDKLRGAEFLIKSINKRRKTIRRVMESILKFQRDFFELGPGNLRPLVLQDVADDVGVHMSTVSRVTTNKYVHTPHGIFELKDFFSAGVRQVTGADLSAEAIKTRIKTLVGKEDRKNPLSDQAIADTLKKEGIRAARRTIAKYREALGILPSSQRKEMF